VWQISESLINQSEKYQYLFVREEVTRLATLTLRAERTSLRHLETKHEETGRPDPLTISGEPVNSLKQIEQVKKQLIQTIGKHVFDHPDEPFNLVARRFEVSVSTVSRYAQKAGFGKRSPGRKKLNGAKVSTI